MAFENLKRIRNEKETQKEKPSSQREERLEKFISQRKKQEEEYIRLQLEEEFEENKKFHFQIVENYNLLRDCVDPIELLEQLAEAMESTNSPTIHFSYSYFDSEPEIATSYGFSPINEQRCDNLYLGGFKTPNEALNEIASTPGDCDVESLFSSSIEIKLILKTSKSVQNDESCINNFGIAIVINRDSIVINEKVYGSISYETIVEALTQICIEENYSSIKQEEKSIPTFEER